MPAHPFSPAVILLAYLASPMAWASQVDDQAFAAEFARQHAQIQYLTDLAELPFARLSLVDAQRVLRESQVAQLPFGPALPVMPNHWRFIVHDAPCTGPQTPAARCRYLEAQGPLGPAVSQVFGPVDLEISGTGPVLSERTPERK